MGKVENKIQNIMSGQPFPNAAIVLQPPGYQPRRQLVLTDGGGGWWMDGQRKSKKIMYFKNFSNTIRYFFLVVSRPLRRVFKTFS